MPAPHNPHGKHILRQIPQENTNLKKRLPGKGGKKKKIMINPERIKKGLYWDRAWSLVEGCTPVSDGCLNCWSARQTYMRQFHNHEKMRSRYQGLVNDQGCFNGHVRLMESDLEKPLHVKQPTTWAIWNDLFHKYVPDTFILKVWQAMGEFYGLDGEIGPVSQRPGHTYLVLTKRPERMREFLSARYPAGFERSTVYIGVTVESANYLWRIEELCSTPAARRFVSIEPMLGPVDLAGDDGGHHFFPFENEQGTITPGIDWVIVGAESGPKRRPTKLKWIKDLVVQCQAVGVPVFVKQLHIDGRLSKNMAEWPEDLRLRQFVGG